MNFFSEYKIYNLLLKILMVIVSLTICLNILVYLHLNYLKKENNKEGKYLTEVYELNKIREKEEKINIIKEATYELKNINKNLDIEKNDIGNNIIIERIYEYSNLKNNILIDLIIIDNNIRVKGKISNISEVDDSGIMKEFNEYIIRDERYICKLINLNQDGSFEIEFNNLDTYEGEQKE